MPKILIVSGDAAESLEAMYPYQRFIEEGYEVHISAPTKKKLQFVVHDFVEGCATYESCATYTEKPGTLGKPTSRTPSQATPRKRQSWS